MNAVKKTISIPKELVKEAIAINHNFSAVVEAALIAYLHYCRVQKAIESFGKWQERTGSSTKLVNKLRQEGNRKYADRSD
jgi:hypothetical protein